MKPSFWGETFFSKCSKNFSIGLMIMFKVCRRCLQRCFLRWKKNYERTIHPSKYIQKKSWPPQPPSGGVNSFNATLTRFGATWLLKLAIFYYCNSNDLFHSLRTRRKNSIWGLSHNFFRHGCQSVISWIYPRFFFRDDF